MQGEISYIGQNPLLYQGVNMFISAVKLGILTWESMGMESFLEPASRGHLKNCNFLPLVCWLHFSALEVLAFISVHCISLHR